MDISDRVSRTRRAVDSLSTFRLVIFLIPTLFLLVLIGSSLAFFLWGSVWTTTPGFGGHFTLEGYRTVFTSPVVRQTLKNTLILAIFGTTVALFAGLFTVIFTQKMDVPGWLRTGVSAVVVIQILIPAFIWGIGWEFYLGPSGPVNRLLMLFPFVNEPVVSSHNIWTIAFIFGIDYAGLVFLLVSGAVRAIPPQQEEIALVSGASKATVFSEIDFPLVFPSVLIAGIIVFIRGIQTFTLPLVLGLSDQVFTLSTLMWFELKEFPRNFTFIAAIGTVILLLSLWLLLIHRKLSGSQDQYETLKGAGESKKTIRFYENRPLAIAFVLFIISTYIMPFAMIVIGSLQKRWAGLRFEFVDWSLEGYRLLLVGRWSDIFYESVINAVLLGTAAGLLTLILSVMVSYLSIKTEWRGGSFLNYLSYSPIAIPALVIASALQWIILEYNDLFGFLYASLYILVIVFSANFMLYCVRAVNSSLRSVGSNLGEIGSILGASRTTIVREIYAPLMKPGLLAGFIIIFIETTKSLSIPLILGGNEFKIVQNTIWRFTSQGETNLAAAYSVLLVVALGVVYAIAYKFDVDLTNI